MLAIIVWGQLLKYLKEKGIKKFHLQIYTERRQPCYQNLHWSLVEKSTALERRLKLLMGQSKQALPVSI